MTSLFVFLILIPLSTSELLHVHILYRHGDRSPIGPIYPKDPHQVNTWPIGLGQLTKVGAQQAFELGRYLRHRYSDFLSKEFNQKEIYIRSSNFNRALMTAEACLSGLYLPTSEREQFNPDIKWNPTPIHSVAKGDDNILLTADCPVIDTLMAEVFKLPIIKKEDKDNENLFKMLGNHTGLHPFSFLTTHRLYDTMFCERSHNLTQPTFVTPKVWQKLHTFSNLGWKIDYHTTKLRQLRGGSLLHEILEDMKAISQLSKVNYPKGRKVKMYSAHDSTVSAYLAAAGVYNDIQPPYASVVMTELRKENGEYIVRLFYRNSTGEALLLKIPGCSTSCPLTKLPDLWSATLLPPSIRKDLCHNVSKSNSSVLTLALSYTLGCVSFIGLVCIVVFCIAYILRRRQRYRRYSRLDTYMDGEAMVNLNSGS